MPLIPVILNVSDSASKTPIPGAVVNIQGTNYRTGSTGTTKAWVDPSSFDGVRGISIRTEASGYITEMKSLPLTPIVNTINIFLVLDGSAVSVLVVRQDTRVPIVGANVYVDSGAPHQTDAHGRAALSLHSGLNIIKASAPGFIEAALNYSVTIGLAPPSPVFALVPAGAQPGKIHVFVAPYDDPHPAPTSGLSVTTTAGLLVESHVLSEDGDFTSNEDYSDGATVTVVVSGADWATLTTSILVDSGQEFYVLGPMKRTADNTAGGIDTGASPAGQDAVQTTLTSDAPIGIPLDLVNPPDSYEYVYPSSEFGKYFTTTQARMYIGNLFVDELNSIQFSLQYNKVPIYGYASRDFDEVGHGKALVQGQLMINYISEGYLYTILKEHKKLQRQVNDLDDSFQKYRQEFENLRKSQEYLQTTQYSLPGDRLDSGSQGANGLQTNVQDLRLQLIEQRMGQLAAIGPQVLDRGRVYQPLTGKDTYTNATYLPVSFDIELELEGAGRVVKRKLERCYLGANEQVLDQSGALIGEVYGFIARRLR